MVASCAACCTGGRQLFVAMKLGGGSIVGELSSGNLLPVVGVDDLVAVAREQGGDHFDLHVCGEEVDRSIAHRDDRSVVKTVDAFEVVGINAGTAEGRKFGRCPTAFARDVERLAAALGVVLQRLASLLDK